ncbi:hypothetical protein WR25_11550 [Diploscapter pachys]|uniref:HhH-GPD domain-containing protein n=1 Tax=Diploscapter pachys TaxID=2018661 RepID=A0A2A2M5A7_9BILA|nr:hypothetical protein WR25_11550 [Diploscapter pachys]
MGLSAEQIRASMDALAAAEPAFAAGLARVGYPPPRLRARGYITLLRTIIGQQVSVASANAVYRKLESLRRDAACGGAFAPEGGICAQPCRGGDERSPKPRCATRG